MGDVSNVIATAQLFAPIQPPKIKSISRKSVQDFLAAREAYVDAVSVQPGVQPVPLRSCFAGVFLKSLIRARVFGAAVKTLHQCTDTIIMAKLEEISGTVRTVSVEAAHADLKRHGRLDPNEPDARLRVTMLSASYLELCEKRGWEFLENSQEAAVRHIVSVLQPAQLKKRMQDALQLEKAELKGDYFGFMEYLADKAEIFEEVLPLHDNLKPPPPKDTPRPGIGTTPRDPKGENTTPKGDSKDGPRPPAKTLPPCLNLSCNERHLVKDCQKKNKEYAKKLLEEFCASKNKGLKPTVAALGPPKATEAPNKPPLSGHSNCNDTAVVKAEINGHNFAC